MADQSYTDAQNSPQWYPSGDQSSSLVYQGSIAVPNACSGGPINFQAGGTFSTRMSSTDTQDTVNVRWHYSGNGSAGGWSGTKSVVPYERRGGTLVQLRQCAWREFLQETERHFRKVWRL